MVPIIPQTNAGLQSTVSITETATIQPTGTANYQPSANSQVLSNAVTQPLVVETPTSTSSSINQNQSTTTPLVATQSKVTGWRNILLAALLVGIIVGGLIAVRGLREREE